MKTILLLLSLLVAGTSFGQSKKNDLKLTISALPLFGSSEGFESGMNGFVIKPGVGYYISDNTSIDFNFTYATYNNLTLGNVDSYYNAYAFMPSFRNNFINKQTFRAFIELGFGLGTIKYEADNNDLSNFRHEDLSGGISVLNIGIGGNYFFNENFGIEIIVPYLITRNITSDKVSNLYTGFGPTLGLTYKLD